jgi:Fic-DOC domain mobile mystery protein B
MSKFKITYPSEATPLDPNEAGELIPDYISTMEELNQLEQANIADAFVWADKESLDDLLTATFVCNLHKKMFDQVWKWAGKMRRSNKNIGVMKEQIMSDLGALLKNAEYWIENRTFPPDELAARFHHRLVHTHVFTNGNGRHARLMTDLVLKRLDEPKFTWGTNGNHTPIEIEGDTRQEYITALTAADNNNFEALITFSRS